MAHSGYGAGDFVVYTKTKFGRRPGPRARSVWPVPQGEGYSYIVDKLWVVVGERSDGRLVLRTPRGKLRVVAAGDCRLRRATLVERLRFRERLATLRRGGDGPPPSTGT